MARRVVQAENYWSGGAESVGPAMQEAQGWSHCEPLRSQPFLPEGQKPVEGRLTAAPKQWVPGGWVSHC